MAEQAWQALDFKGWTPAIDPRKIDQLFLLQGRNITFTAAGPKSTFGNRNLTPYPIGNPEHIQGCRIKLRTGDRCFTFTNDCIMEWSEPRGSWVILTLLPQLVVPERWTFGYLNGVIYFCHPRTGIIEYDLDTKVCQPIQDIGLPPAPQAIVIDNGRLVVMTDQVIAWSWQSDGRNFTPALGEAGAQKIASRVAGYPVMISTTARGVLVWTTGGLLRGEFTADQSVYRFRNVNTEFRPINSFCVLQTDENTAVILDERGLFRSQGEAPEPHAPMFNEFLKRYIQDNRMRFNNNLRIEYDDYRQEMYISESLSRYNPIFERAFVLNPLLDKWGFMNEPHYGIIPIRITESQREGDYFGFVNPDGVAKYWMETGSREVQAVDPTLDLVHPVIQKPFFTEDGSDHRVCSSTIGFSSRESFSGVAGYYPSDGYIVAPPELTGLDSNLRVGLIKLDGLNEAMDQMAEISRIMIGNTESGRADNLREDYNLIPDGVSDEDYNLAVGEEDFGIDPINYINHKTRMIGTLDGTTPFTWEVPELVLFTRGVRHYSCSVIGVWHMLEMAAEDVGEAIHLKVFQLTATYAGVYS